LSVLNKNIWHIPKYWRQHDIEPLIFDFYRINECGEIVSLITKKRMKNVKGSHGYEYINLFHPKTINPKNKRPKKGLMYRVHKLVACTFLENSNRYLYNVVDHIDSNKTNNCVDNLEWVTYSENSRRARNKSEKEHIEVIEIAKNQLSLFPDGEE